MSHEDRVLALFADANPVPDDAALADLMRPSLQLIEQREDAMSDMEVRDINTDRPIIHRRHRRALLGGAAAAVLAVIVGTVGWLALTSSSDDGPDAAASDQIAVIETFFQRWSEGDLEGAFALVGDQDRETGNTFLGPNMEYVIALEPDGWFWSVTGCVEQVPGTFTCRVELVGDPVLDAVGASSGGSQFTIEDGKLVRFPRVLGVQTAQADRVLAQYAERLNPDGYQDACVGANGRAWEQNGVIYDGACGAFLSEYLEPLAAELRAP